MSEPKSADLELVTGTVSCGISVGLHSLADCVSNPFLLCQGTSVLLAHPFSLSLSLIFKPLTPLSIPAPPPLPSKNQLKKAHNRRKRKERYAVLDQERKERKRKRPKKERTPAERTAMARRNRDEAEIEYAKVRVALDCAWAEEMTDKEQKSTISQLNQLYCGCGPHTQGRAADSPPSVLPR